MIRLGIIGWGAAARDLHLPAYRQLAGTVTLVSACDPDPSARKHAQGCGLEQVFNDPESMIRATQPDMVAVCTPPAAHFESVMLALERGCHVFCEKPMTEDLADADAIIAAAERLNRSVVVNTQYPVMKIHAAAKQWLGTAEFGRLLSLHASQFREPLIDSGWRVGTWRRTCCDMTLHILELLRFFFDDDPARILAYMPDAARIGRELQNVIAVEFADGRAASIVVNRTSQGRREFLTLRLEGEFASIRTQMDSEVCLRLGLYPGKKRGYVRFDRFRGGVAVLERGNRCKQIATEGMNPFVSGTAANLQQYVKAIEAGTQPLFTARHHRKTLELVLAAYESAESGRWIHLGCSTPASTAAIG